jgi:nucleoid-associated protein YgaU
MGIFGHHGDDEQEAQDKQRYEDAQRRLAEARRDASAQHPPAQQQPPSSPRAAQGVTSPVTSAATAPAVPASGTLGMHVGLPGPTGGQQPLGGTETPPAGGTALGARAGAGMSLSDGGARGEPSRGDYQTYTVKKGDTLTGIAHHFYGRASASREILDANRGVLKDADHIREGQVLRIPRRGSGQLA